jgi:uncharacterized protein YpmS
MALYPPPTSVQDWVPDSSATHHTTMTQERLNGLVTIAIENDVLEKIKYEDIIEEFISKNSRRMMLFIG